MCVLCSALVLEKGAFGYLGGGSRDFVCWCWCFVFCVFEFWILSSDKDWLIFDCLAAWLIGLVFDWFAEWQMAYTAEQ